jgi:hypothetical protein
MGVSKDFKGGEPEQISQKGGMEKFHFGGKRKKHHRGKHKRSMGKR